METIGLSTITASQYYGAVLLRANPGESRLREFPARVTRTATLDGGAVIYHGGYSDGDRTVDVQAVDMTTGEVAILENMAQNQTLLTLALGGDCFSGAISNLQTDNGNVSFTFLIKEKVSA